MAEIEGYHPVLNVENSGDGSAIDWLTGRCAADGPNGSIYCSEPENNEIIYGKSEDGVNYGLFYSDYIEETHYYDNFGGQDVELSRTEREVVEKGAGPFIFVPLSDPFTLLFYPDIHLLDRYPLTFKDDLKIIYDTLKFIPPSEAGIGVLINTHNSETHVLTTLKNSPAALGGIESGDVITTVDNIDIGSMSIDQVSELLRGPVDTEVNISIKKNNGEQKNITIRRRPLYITEFGNDISERLHEINIYFDPEQKLYELARSQNKSGIESYNPSMYIYSNGLYAGHKKTLHRFENGIPNVLVNGSNWGQSAKISPSAYLEDLDIVISSMSVEQMMEDELKRVYYPSTRQRLVERWDEFLKQDLPESENFKLSLRYSTNLRNYRNYLNITDKINLGDEIRYKIELEGIIPVLKRL